MGKIFISYRRADDPYASHHIRRELATRFGRDDVFMDVDNIPFGADFVEHLDNEVRQCDILIAVIGDRWLELLEQYQQSGRPDFVEIEIRSALKRNIPVIPVLVRKAEMPPETRLPESLKPLVRRHAAEVRDGPDLESHLSRLVRGIEYLMKQKAEEKPPNPPPQPPMETVASEEDAIRFACSQCGHRLKIGAHHAGKQAKCPQCQSVVTIPDGKSTAPELLSFPLTTTQAQAYQKAWADHLGIAPVWTNPDGARFAWIPPGAFLMGSPETEKDRGSDEVQHKVTLTKGFYMGIYPVTQADWQAVMGDNPSEFKGDNRPVEMVSWDDCQEFCRKISERDGRTYRLPTEAEWEYACRAGTLTAYYTGDGLAALKQAGWCSYDGKWGSGKETKPVGTFQPNAWGLYDMHGNVWEWCEDWYGDYPKGDIEDPKGIKSGESRVLRGGSWHGNPANCRSAFRCRVRPDVRYDYFGCRVCFFLD